MAEPRKARSAKRGWLRSLSGRRALKARLEDLVRRDLKTALDRVERDPTEDVEKIAERLALYDTLREKLGTGKRAERLWGAAILVLCVGAVGMAWSQRLRSPEIELDADASAIRLWQIDSLSWRGRLELAGDSEQVFSGFSELRLDGGRVRQPQRVLLRGEAALEDLRLAGDGPIVLRSLASRCVMITGAATIRAVISIGETTRLEVDTPGGKWSPPALGESQLQLLRAPGSEHPAGVRLCIDQPWRLAGTAPGRMQIAEPYPLEPGKELFLPSLRSGTVTLRSTGQEITLSDRDKLVLRAARGTAVPPASAVFEVDRSVRVLYQGRVEEIALVHGRYEENLSPTWIEYLQTRRFTLFFGTMTTILGILWGLRKLVLW